MWASVLVCVEKGVVEGHNCEVACCLGAGWAVHVLEVCLQGSEGKKTEIKEGKYGEWMGTTISLEAILTTDGGRVQTPSNATVIRGGCSLSYGSFFLLFSLSAPFCESKALLSCLELKIHGAMHLRRLSRSCSTSFFAVHSHHKNSSHFQWTAPAVGVIA